MKKRGRVGFAVAVGLAGLSAALSPLVACGDSPAASSAAGDGGSLDGSPAPGDAAFDAGDALDASAGDAFLEAPHAPYPQVTYGGGPVLARPHLVVVTFAGDPMSGVVDDFVTGVTSSDWWSAVTAGACDDGGCVGPARQVDLVTLPLGPPTSSPDGGDAGAYYDQPSVQTILHGALSSGALPVPDEDALYILAFPLGTFLTTLDPYSNVLVGCSSFLSYHHEIYIGDIAFDGGAPGYDRLPLIALPRCSRQAMDITVPLGRALVATTTDPAGTAYVLRDVDGWNAYYGDELPDLCGQAPPITVTDDAGNATVLPRSWSNAASDGGDPCVPSDGQPYFAAIPRMTSTLYLEPTGSMTLPVDAFAQDDGDFQLEVGDLDDILAGVPTLSVQLDRTTVHNGDTVNLSVSFANKPPERGFGVFVVFAERGTTTHAFPVAVRDLGTADPGDL
jgi:hypothetical protein